MVHAFDLDPKRSVDGVCSRSRRGLHADEHQRRPLPMRADPPGNQPGSEWQEKPRVVPHRRQQLARRGTCSWSRRTWLGHSATGGSCNVGGWQESACNTTRALEAMQVVVIWLLLLAASAVAASTWHRVSVCLSCTTRKYNMAARGLAATLTALRPWTWRRIRRCALALDCLRASGDARLSPWSGDSTRRPRPRLASCGCSCRCRSLTRNPRGSGTQGPTRQTTR